MVVQLVTHRQKTKLNNGDSFTAEEINGSKIVRLPAQCARRMKMDESTDDIEYDHAIRADTDPAPKKEDTGPRTRKKFVDYTFY